MLRNIFCNFIIVSYFVLSFAAFPNITAASETDILFSDDLKVQDENLEEMRGTALSPEILGIAVFDAISTNNTTTGTVSGGNTIDTGAFSYSSGLSTVIQNSGNNVLIQSATILNVNID